MKKIIIPLILIIGIIIYSKKSQSSKLRKIITTLLAMAIAVLLCFGVDKIIELFNLDSLESKDLTYLSNARQKALVSQALKSVEAAIVSSKNQVPLEMVAVDLKDAFDSLGEVIGVSYREELLDQLFSNFCLGK